METATKSNLPTGNPNPEEIAASTASNPSEVIVPNANAEIQPTSQPANPLSPPPISSTPQPQNAVTQPSASVVSPSLASMAGTVKATEPRKSKKVLYIVLSTVFIILWAAFWALFFGLINI